MCCRTPMCCCKRVSCRSECSRALRCARLLIARSGATRKYRERATSSSQALVNWARIAASRRVEPSGRWRVLRILIVECRANSQTLVCCTTHWWSPLISCRVNYDTNANFADYFMMRMYSMEREMYIYSIILISWTDNNHNHNQRRKSIWNDFEQRPTLLHPTRMLCVASGIRPRACIYIKTNINVLVEWVSCTVYLLQASF